MLSRRGSAGVLVLALFALVGPSLAGQSAAPALPTTLSNADFWALSTGMSEPGGFFRSENLVSNEHTYQYVIPALQQAARPGGVYLGVAPDQNFTYMAAVQPRLAFILDVRRGNLLQHLMYKAVFELSRDRADFVSRLFSKARPAGLTTKSSVLELFSAYARVGGSEALYKRNAAAIKNHLVATRGIPLSDEDWAHLESIYFSFFIEGPAVRYTSGPGNPRGFRGSRFPTYQEMIVQTDYEGVPRSYLATEGNFRLIKGLHARNLIVPVVGNFAGPKALRSIGRYLRARAATVSTYYVSNVEQYLFQDRLFDAFARNVAVLPVDGRSTFVRSVSNRFGYSGGMTWDDGRASALYPIAQFVRDHELGLLTSYYDLNSRSR
jgi:hypothetical protein